MKVTLSAGVIVLATVYLGSTSLSAEEGFSARGVWNNNHYHNKLFDGLTITVPVGWNHTPINLCIRIGGPSFARQEPIPDGVVPAELIYDAQFFKLSRDLPGSSLDVIVGARSKIGYASLADLVDKELRDIVDGLGRSGVRVEGTGDKGTTQLGGRPAHYQGFQFVGPKGRLRGSTFYVEGRDHYYMFVVSALPAAGYPEAVDALRSMASFSDKRSLAPAESTELETALKSFDRGQVESAIPILEEHASSDNRALCRLGLATLRGMGRNSNIEEGVKLLRVGADKGDPYCLAELGDILISGWFGQSRQRSVGLRMIEQASEAGSVRGRALLASRLIFGEELPRDCKRASALLSVLGSDEDSAAVFVRATLYNPSFGCAKDLGLSQSMDSTLALTRRAIGMKSIPALSQMGVFYLRGQGVPQSDQEAKTLFEEASEHGSPVGMLLLAHVKLYSKMPGLLDAPSAISLLEKANKLGYTRAKTELGALYLQGTLVTRDVNRGLRYLNEAVLEEEPAAVEFLANAYDLGNMGLPKDPAKALSFSSTACNLNRAEMCVLNGALHYKGVGTGKDPARAALLFEKALKLGSAGGYLWLGICFERGDGKPRNPSEAIRLYRVAESMGHPEAAKLINNFQSRSQKPRGWVGFPF